MEQIILGRKYVDKLSGFKGIATGRVQYITGCNQVLVQPWIGADNDMKDPRWMDEQRMMLDPTDSSFTELDNGETPGSDLPAPLR